MNPHPPLSKIMQDWELTEIQALICYLVAEQYSIEIEYPFGTGKAEFYLYDKQKNNAIIYAGSNISGPKELIAKKLDIIEDMVGAIADFEKKNIKLTDVLTTELCNKIKPELITNTISGNDNVDKMWKWYKALLRKCL